MQKRLITILVAGFVMVALSTSAWGVCKAEVVSSLTYKTAAAVTGADPAPPTVAQASHQVAPTASLAAGPALNREGRTERVADVLIWDDGTGGCFLTTNTIRITYNASLTNPASVSAATTANFDVFDSAGVSGLVISAASTVGLAPGGTPQTVITITILQKGTDTADITTGDVGSGVRIKNLRVDASSLSDAVVAAASSVATVTVSQSAGLIALVGGINTVGTAHNSFTGGAVTTPGVGIQNAGSGLSTQAFATLAENFAGMMRVAGGTCNSTTLTSDTCISQVANDIATNATDLVFDAGTTLPSGVSVTWPATISTSNQVVGTAGGGLILNLANTPTCGGGAASPCFAIYSTIKGDTGTVSSTAATLNLTTATAATYGGIAPVCGASPLPACGSAAATPQVVVAIASTSGAGVVTMHAFMGPGEASGSTDDDVNASGVPRYIAFNGKPTGTAASRNIIGGGSTATTWFTVGSNKTVILYPYVTNLFGYQTGIVVSNTSNDSTVYSATTPTQPQKGGLKFYFFPTAGTPFTLNTDVTTGGIGNIAGTRGLDTNGQLSGGSVFAAGIGTLLTAAGQPAGASFDGYIIVVTSFQFAHGQVAVISPNGTAAYSDVGILADLTGTRVATEKLAF